MQKYFLTEEFLEIEKSCHADWMEHMTPEGLELKIQYCRLSSLAYEIGSEMRDTEFYGEKKRLWTLLQEVEQEIKYWQTASGLFDQIYYL